MKIRSTACSIPGKLLLSLFFLLFSLTIFGQTKTVTGTIRDDKGQPLAGATVTVKGSPGGTSTDANGNFSISAPENASLIISAVGTEAQEIQLKGQASVDLKL